MHAHIYVPLPPKKKRIQQEYSIPTIDYSPITILCLFCFVWFQNEYKYCLGFILFWVPILITISICIPDTHRQRVSPTNRVYNVWFFSPSPSSSSLLLMTPICLAYYPVFFPLYFWLWLASFLACVWSYFFFFIDFFSLFF